MKTKRIVITICALVAAVLTFVGGVFAVNYWYNVSGEANYNLVVGSAITIKVNGETTQEGNHTTEIQPGTRIVSPVYTIKITQTGSQEHYDYLKNPSENVQNHAQLNVYFVINETLNTADTQFWTIRCATGTNAEFTDRTEPIGANQVTSTTALPLKKATPGEDGKYYDKLLLLSNVGLGDTFYMEIVFSDKPALVETQRTLAFDLVLEVAYDNIDPNA